MAEDRPGDRTKWSFGQLVGTIDFTDASQHSTLESKMGPVPPQWSISSGRNLVQPLAVESSGDQGMTQESKDLHLGCHRILSEPFATLGSGGRENSLPKFEIQRSHPLLRKTILVLNQIGSLSNWTKFSQPPPAK